MEQISPEAVLVTFVVLVLAGAVSASVITKLRRLLKDKEASLAELQERFAHVIDVEAEASEKEQEVRRLEAQIEKAPVIGTALMTTL
jgi:hypothetical protein